MDVAMNALFGELLTFSSYRSRPMSCSFTQSSISGLRIEEYSGSGLRQFPRRRPCSVARAIWPGTWPVRHQTRRESLPLPLRPRLAMVCFSFPAFSTPSGTVCGIAVNSASIATPSRISPGCRIQRFLSGIVLTISATTSVRQGNNSHLMSTVSRLSNDWRRDFISTRSSNMANSCTMPGSLSDSRVAKMHGWIKSTSHPRKRPFSSITSLIRQRGGEDSTLRHSVNSCTMRTTSSTLAKPM